jgi:hypothetical protein
MKGGSLLSGKPVVRSIDRLSFHFLSLVFPLETSDRLFYLFQRMTAIYNWNINQSKYKTTDS